MKRNLELGIPTEFKLEDWFPMSPLEGPPLPKWLDLTWPWYKPPGAEFKISNLVISPVEVKPGQVVTISCTVTNIGAEAGNYTIKMGGDFTAAQTVELAPSESRVVTFEVIPEVAKHYSVLVDGLSGSFEAIAVTGATLYGWVKDRTTGKPVPNSRIQIGPAWGDWPWEGYSDAEGYYEIANIPVSEAIYEVDNIPWFSLRYTAPPELQYKYPGLGSFVLLPAGERTRYDWNLLARY